MTTATKQTAEDRLIVAMRMAGLSRGQVERKLGHKLERWRQFLRQIVRIAELLDCDARWLATGQKSPAAAMAVEAVRHALEKTGVPANDRDKLLEFAGLTAELAGEPGVCRYCGCVDERACAGGCCWVDDEQTICSACLSGEGK